jgi:major vault protein
VLKGAAKKHTAEAFYASSVEVMRDVVLGRPDDKGERPGMRFAENGMVVKDVEVLRVEIDDERIAGMLAQAQHEAIESSITVLRETRGLEVTQKREVLKRHEADAVAATARAMSDLEVEAVAGRLKVAMAALAADVTREHERKKAVAAAADAGRIEHEAELARERSAAGVKQEIAAAEQAMRLEALRAEADAAIRRFEAAQSGFSEALLALGNEEVLVKVAEAMSVQNFVGGKTLTDVIDKVFAETPLQGLMDRVKAKTALKGGNGKHSGPERPSEARRENSGPER